MTRPADVLVSRTLDTLYSGAPTLTERREMIADLIEARAAVAELIEAAAELEQYALDCYHGNPYTGCADPGAAVDRIAAALARVGGGR